MRSLTRRARLAEQLIRTQGIGWVAFRLRHALDQRSGRLRRRLPVTDWNEQPLASFLRDSTLAAPDAYASYRRGLPATFLFAPDDRADAQPWLTRQDGQGTGPIARADELQYGIWRYFEQTPVAVGNPPAWHRNPFTEDEAPADRHWSQVGDFQHGDIKAIWELSRFGFAYTLVRAYWRTGNPSYPELFWQLLESWREHNPPQAGPNWKCGQETSLRVMAWCFSLYGFLRAPSTTGARLTALAQMVAVSANRIEGLLEYALSQRNNHGISEGMGLWTIGLLFPELRDAARWRERGRRVLEDQGRRLIYDDGAFSQHSVNYHRLMLHDYLWSLRLGDLNGMPFSAALRQRVGRAGDLLYQMQDESSGRVPNYGQNDGALILPLSNCDARDFRPVLQATRYLTTGNRAYPDGPWDEETFWLFGAKAACAPVVTAPREDLRAATGGYFTLRSSSGFAFVRCAGFRHRPSQADMLHTDIWWRGQNVAIDAGTYSYNAPPPWDNALAHTAAHNTVTVDDASQMEQAGKFLWLPWLNGRWRAYQRSRAGHLAYWEGSHDGYGRLSAPVLHRRAIMRLAAEHWLILDRLTSRGSHRYRLHWLLPDLPYELGQQCAAPAMHKSGLHAVTLATSAGAYAVQVGSLHRPAEGAVIRADETTARGWRAPSYMAREPALSLSLEYEGEAATFWSLLGPSGGTARVIDDHLEVATPGWTSRMRLGGGAAEPLATDIVLTGAIEDALTGQA